MKIDVRLRHQTEAGQAAHAKSMPDTIGCRVVLSKSEPAVVGFYKKLGFQEPSQTGASLTDMFLDIKHM